jgi:hypothetical protein
MSEAALLLEQVVGAEARIRQEMQSLAEALGKAERAEAAVRALAAELVSAADEGARLASRLSELDSRNRELRSQLAVSRGAAEAESAALSASRSLLCAGLHASGCQL